MRRDAHAAVVLVRGDTDLATWPLVHPGRPDLRVVEALARWQLTARRAGCTLRLRDVSPDLGALLRVAGLAELFAVAPAPCGPQPGGGDPGPADASGGCAALDRRDA